jgi:hypothetical protein
MKWANDLSPASVTGKQTLTGDRPITAIHRAVKEIQDLAVVSAEVTINGETLSATVRDNVLEISGEIEVGEDNEGVLELPETALQWQVLTWDGAKWIAGWVRVHS